jgi:hypothetical protein
MVFSLDSKKLYLSVLHPSPAASEKDELIISLWETLVTIESANEVSRPPAFPATAPGTQSAAPPRSTSDLRERIRTSTPSRRAQARSAVSVQPRLGFEFLASKAVLVTVAVISFGFLADFGIGWYQRRLVAARERAALELRSAAFSGLYVELIRIVYEPDGKSYRATLNMQNPNSEAPLYVMLNPARVFAQAGMTWQEVPSYSANEPSARVVKLDGAREYSVEFQANLKDWAELIPGYLHMRIQSDMLISQSSEPKDDIVERNNRFYVYLKPQAL